MCCGPAIAGYVPAATAEALMRSRYTAYATSAIAYLVATLAAASRGKLNIPAITKWSRTTVWRSLEIIATERGGISDEDGIVEFVARGVTTGVPFEQRERSRFRRERGVWVYVDGAVR